MKTTAHVGSVARAKALARAFRAHLEDRMDKKWFRELDSTPQFLFEPWRYEKWIHVAATANDVEGIKRCLRHITDQGATGIPRYDSVLKLGRELAKQLETRRLEPNA